MKVAVVLSFETPNPEVIADILSAINPPELPHFAGQARIAIGPEAKYVEAWLDGAK
jgi:hypothetical protein